MMGLEMMRGMVSFCDSIFWMDGWMGSLDGVGVGF